ncbi:MAG: hypothetical protein QOE73_1857 [Verrucomicrobiota bacterium]
MLVLLLVSPAFARDQSPATTPARPQPLLQMRQQSFARPGSKGGPSLFKPASEQSLLARVTVYWASGGRGSDGYTRQHKSATGLRLRSGHCAVDPRKIPYGSQIIFPDRTGLVAVDTGSAVRSRKAARKGGATAYEKSAIVVDRFFETKGQALAWARRNPAFVTVRVVPPTSRQQPLTQTRQGFQVAGNTTPFTAGPATERKSRFPSTGLTSTPSVPVAAMVQPSQVATPAAQLTPTGSTVESKPTFQSADRHGPIARISH